MQQIRGAPTGNHTDGWRTIINSALTFEAPWLEGRLAEASGLREPIGFGLAFFRRKISVRDAVVPAEGVLV